MSWQTDLQNASFRGVTFDVYNTKDSISREVATHEYPFIDGGDVMDLGRKPRNFRISAVFWGDNYKRDMDNLIAVLDEPGKGELIHPVHGSIPQAQCIEYSIGHEAENVDSCSLELVFLEANTGTQLAQAHPEQLGDDIFDKINQLSERMSDLFEQVMAPVNKGVRYLAKGKAALSGMMNTLIIMRGDFNGAFSDGVNYLSYPRAFINDLQSVLDVRTSAVGDLLNLKFPGVINTKQSNSYKGYSSPFMASNTPQNGYLPNASQTVNVEQGVNATTLLSAWSDSVAVVDELVSLPVALVQEERAATVPMPSNAQPADVQDLVVLYQVMAVAEIAAITTQVLADTVQPNQMSPADIELMVNEVRTLALQAIITLRTDYQPRTQSVSSDAEPIGLLWQGVVSSLKEVALGVQTLGLRVIEKRPPLTRKTLTAPANFHLLAHTWYGDYRRATELHRLNPQVRNPNFLQVGDIINAYAR
ncbi:DNA circularization protein [Providencia huaxiensis]|uniref:DNA circularization protein n=1 Tax=Providencia huaxiensis TaxID=2027290 RepID=UPI000E10C459|nr:DNA circularization N-terminal domain-containing protein [Providencia huaxiensis]AXH61269.1 multidrug DMT transporter permease [Providencia huaxiensis]